MLFHAQKSRPTDATQHSNSTHQPSGPRRAPPRRAHTAQTQTHRRAGLDLITWEVGTDGTATVCRLQPLDLEYLRAAQGTLGEWAGAADEEAYRGF